MYVCMVCVCMILNVSSIRTLKEPRKDQGLKCALFTFRHYSDSGHGISTSRQDCGFIPSPANLLYPVVRASCSMVWPEDGQKKAIIHRKSLPRRDKPCTSGLIGLYIVKTPCLIVRQLHRRRANKQLNKVVVYKGPFSIQTNYIVYSFV
jgi:hypothetical protein